MRVITPGRKQKGWAQKYKCTGEGNGNGGCGAILLVEQDDLYHTYKYSYDGSCDIFVTFKCSECSVETDIPNHHAPQYLTVKDKAETVGGKK